jgi:hypothetical protein
VGDVIQGAVVAVSVVLGVLQLARSVSSTLGVALDGGVVAGLGLGAAVAALVTIFAIVRRSRSTFIYRLMHMC